MTNVQDVIDHLTDSVGPIENTVDILKFGDPNTRITGIATTFMATHQAIQQAVEVGANLLITHEGAFYSHHDSDLLTHDPVFEGKLKAIEQAGLAIYRFHDHIHRYQPDGITAALVKALRWQPYIEKQLLISTLLKLPKRPLKVLSDYVKTTLKLPFVRVQGDLSMPCSRVGLLVGYRGGGQTALPLFEKENLDLIITGEGPEWETPEYVRDAIDQGKHKALMVLGHSESESPGMKALAEGLKIKFPNIPIHFISNQPLFQVI
ncbi:hypothetical protein GCM10011391_00100 [Pullulanibacillus camelliae]|uniref:GTP cyclohydrolase 1 type 2 homolog n=1 Tax=Pullulanibacillus camelliae TaxID=1707096 RepID=A0A8J2VJR4_9BACL|nr:Nif3-like dinuclear metal center hexameric protein [Pullulanibacillus camelliae]GGE25703.1 hypothetical protein GCM10011391_00100 [Pullulanibacillus camelliae]